MRLGSPCERNLLIATKKRSTACSIVEKSTCCARRHDTCTTRATTFHTKIESILTFSRAGAHTHSRIETHKMPESRQQKCANQLIIYVKLNKSSSRTEYPPKIIKRIQKQTNDRANERTNNRKIE